MNKIIVAVCVYDRLENIKKWITCWNMCIRGDAELIIVHNNYNDECLKESFSLLCKKNNILYVGCNRPGFDIGRFQDVCRERLEGFPNDWDYLLWNCDDTIPMQKDFIAPFITALQHPKVAVSCMQLSNSIATHIRTTGFCIKKEIANKLVFPVDPITTKQHCYLFEHRAGMKTFYKQLYLKGLQSVQVALDQYSPLWDTGYHKRLNRQAEHDQVFGFDKVLFKTEADKVLFICPIYNMYPAIISSLICQTHKNWELLLIHNGPEVNGLDTIVNGYNDTRIKFIIHPIQTGNYGHPLRQWALQQDSLMKDADYIVITNADNFHVPPYCEYMLKGFMKSSLTKASYCTSMVHSYIKWGVIPVQLKLGYIDCAGVMVTKDVACQIGWQSMEHSSDWIYFNSIIKKYGVKSFMPVPGCLLVHNAFLPIFIIMSAIRYLM